MAKQCPFATKGYPFATKGCPFAAKGHPFASKGVYLPKKATLAGTAEPKNRVVVHFEVWPTKLPSSDEEGWLRGKEKVAKPPWPAQTGWC